MRHKKQGRKFGRHWEHRKAMFRNMARALLTHGRIKTTEHKAKELRSVVEKLITLALRNDLHSRRLAYKVLENHQLVQKLFDEIGPAFAGAGGGYTRLVKLAMPRLGDAAAMSIIELTKSPSAPVEIKPAKAAAPAKVEESAQA